MLGDVPGELLVAAISYDPRWISESNDSTELVLGRMVVGAVAGLGAAKGTFDSKLVAEEVMVAGR